MKPHIAILFAEKPQEVQQRLEVFQRGELPLSPGPVRGLHKALAGAQIRIQETEHQGYANYETFCVDVGITNDRRRLEYWLRAAQRALVAPDPTRLVQFGIEEAAAMDLADKMKDYYETLSEQASANLPSPLCEWLRAGFEAVDWLELGRLHISRQKNEMTTV